MSSAEINKWLQAGITAAKAGERENAQKHLMDVLQADEENELAWLWLSGVVQKVDDRRVCLENVLTLNPDNRLAQRGLDKLGIQPESYDDDSQPGPKLEEKVFRREFVPFSPASAILFPERQTQELRWQEPIVQQKAAQIEIKQSSAYDDIWSRNEDMCGYCAHPISFDDIQCPNCKRNLVSKRFTYAEPTSSLHVYWVLLVGLGQIFLIEALVHIIFGQHYFIAGGYALVMVALWGLAAGVYFRQSWAHIGSLIVLIMLLMGFLVDALIEVDLSLLGLDTLDSSFRDFASPLIRNALSFLIIFEIVTAVLGLFYGVFKAGPEFEQKDTKLIATITKGRRTPSDYHAIAQRLARKDLWASAVLHWQRAAAQEPGQLTYQKQLGLAYAHLGFYHRSIDVLQSAVDLSSYAPTKAKLENQLQLVKEKLAAQERETAVIA